MANVKNIKLVIASLFAQGNKDNVIGYRIASINSDSRTAEIKDIPTQSLKAILQSGMKFGNVAIAGGDIKGTNGSLERLPKMILGGKQFANYNLLICFKIGNEGFKVINCFGTVANLRNDEILQMIKNGSYDDIANGKVVERDGLEYISAINGEYATVALEKKTVVKIKASDIVDTQKEQRVLNSTINMQHSIVREEIDYNDTFRVLNKQQREVIEKYYTWWTTKTFDSLSEGGREELKANPKKVARLAELRGKDIKWAYAGSRLAKLYNPSGFDTCTLGHKLQMVHFAKGVGADGTVQYIKFGSTCSADFFDITPDAMRKLTKVTDKMKEEVQQIISLAEDGKLKERMGNTPLMIEIFNAGTKGQHVEEFKNFCIQYFGTSTSKYIDLFIEAGVPLPESLVNMARERAMKVVTKELETTPELKNYRLSYYYDKSKYNYFWRQLLTALGLCDIQEDKDLAAGYGGALQYTRGLTCMSMLATEPGLEGIYGYDPIKKVGARGKGRFTKDAARERAMDLRRTLRFGCDNGIPTLGDMADAFRLYELYEKTGKQSFEYIKNRLEFIKASHPGIDLGYYDANHFAEKFLTKSWTLDRDKLYGFIAGLQLTVPGTRYSYGVSNFPKIPGSTKSTTIHSITEIAQLIKDNKQEFVDEINKIISDGLEDKINEYKEKKERAYRESIVCTNPECKFNSDGVCTQIVENGLGSDIRINPENNSVVACNKFEKLNVGVGEKSESKENDIDSSVSESDTAAEKEDSLAIKFQTLKKFLSDVGKEVVNDYEEIAEKISEREPEDEELTYKQKKVLMKACSCYEDKILEMGYIYKNGSVVKGTKDEVKKAIEQEEAENWKKTLEEAPEIHKMLDEIAKAKPEMSYLEENIINSVNRYKKVSSKQFKHIQNVYNRLNK